MSKTPTVAAVTLRDATFERETSVFQALKVFFGRCWPAFGGSSALWLGVEIKADPILLIQLTLDIDQREGGGNLFLLFFQSVNVFQNRSSRII